MDCYEKICSVSHNVFFLTGFFEQTIHVYVVQHSKGLEVYKVKSKSPPLPCTSAIQLRPLQATAFCSVHCPTQGCVCVYTCILSLTFQC